VFGYRPPARVLLSDSALICRHPPERRSGGGLKSERVLSQQVRLADQEVGPHADMTADALVRLEPLDAAHPIGRVAEFVIPV
jgi:hypothetical protein